MSRLEEAAAASTKGSFTLFIGSSASLFMSAAGVILVARLLSPSEYGLYAVATVLPELFILFTDWGINPALTRFIAHYSSRREPAGIRRLWWTGFTFKFTVGLILSVALFLSADVLSNLVLMRPGVGGFVRATSIVILAHSLYSMIISALVGLERMEYTAAINISLGVVRGVCSPLLVYMGFGVYGAIAGNVLSYYLSAAIGLLLICFSLPKLEDSMETPEFSGGRLRIMLEFGLPLFAGGLVLAFSSRLQIFLLSWFTSDEAIGNYNLALKFVSLAGLVTNSINTTLFPVFSKFSHASEPENIKEVYLISVRYSALIVIPMTALLAVLSEPAIYTLFTSKYPEAPLYFQLLLVPTLLVGAGSLSLPNLFNSQGDTGTTLKMELISAATFILLSPILVLNWNVVGLIAGIIVSRIVRTIFGQLVLERGYKASSDWRFIGYTLLCSSVSAGLVYGVLWLLPGFTAIIRLLAGTATFITAYLVLAPLLGAIEESDITRLNSMLRGLRIIYPIAHLILAFEKKLIRKAKGR